DPRNRPHRNRGRRPLAGLRRRAARRPPPPPPDRWLPGGRGGDWAVHARFRRRRRTDLPTRRDRGHPAHVRRRPPLFPRGSAGGPRDRLAGGDRADRRRDGGGDRDRRRLGLGGRRRTGAGAGPVGGEHGRLAPGTRRPRRTAHPAGTGGHRVGARRRLGDGRRAGAAAGLGRSPRRRRGGGRRRGDHLCPGTHARQGRHLRRPDAGRRRPRHPVAVPMGRPNGLPRAVRHRAAGRLPRHRLRRLGLVRGVIRARRLRRRAGRRPVRVRSRRRRTAGSPRRCLRGALLRLRRDAHRPRHLRDRARSRRDRRRGGAAGQTGGGVGAGAGTQRQPAHSRDRSSEPWPDRRVFLHPGWCRSVAGPATGGRPGADPRRGVRLDRPQPLPLPAGGRAGGSTWGTIACGAGAGRL
ncbi:MAG: Inner membrane protein YbaL, KefB/KefC family, partial [uncultured Thermomicrobiales bacterium]